MADNVTIPAQGTGSTTPVIASDDIGGIQYQRCKVTWGADGSSVDASAANPFPVTIISGSISVTGTMPVSSAIATQVDGHSANIGLLADASSANTLTGLLKAIKALLASPIAVTGGGGGTQFAEDAAHTTGDLGTQALAVRKDTATALSGTDGDYTPLITDASGRQHVNVGTSALPTGAATAAKQPALGTAGAAATDVITIQGIASGTVVPISVATIPSHAVTNAGTFAVQVSAALPAGTNNIGDVDVLTLPALPAGSNNIGDVDVLTLPSLPAGANAIGKLAANSGVDIGDVDVLSLPALPAGTNAIGKLAANSGVDIGDVDVTSSTSAAATTATITRTSASASNVANLVALNTARTGLIIVNDSSATLYLKYGTTASTTSFTYIIPPGVTWEMPHNPRYTGRIDGIWSAANGSAQITELSA